VLNKTNATGLDRAALNGVNVTAIRMLKQKASNLTGPQVAAIARSIAGPPAGVPAGPPQGVPGKVGGGNRVGPRRRR
ncbi:MAG: hypothetical protein SV760_04545, partial [Halobacteria archaeon]|nr:hypothetical protein [Halobacteria archaeon]